MPNLILVRGVSGSGKSTVVRMFGNCPNVSADEFFTMPGGSYKFDPSKLNEAHKWCQTVVEDIMEVLWCDIAVHNTFTTEWEMQPYFDLAEKYGYKVFTIIVENRHGNKSIHNVPEATIKAQAERLSKSIKLVWQKSLE